MEQFGAANGVKCLGYTMALLGFGTTVSTEKTTEGYQDALRINVAVMWWKRKKKEGKLTFNHFDRIESSPTIARNIKRHHRVITMMLSREIEIV